MLRNHQQLEPELSDLIDFSKEEMLFPNDWLFFREALKEYTDKHSRS